MVSSLKFAWAKWMIGCFCWVDNASHSALYPRVSMYKIVCSITFGSKHEQTHVAFKISNTSRFPAQNCSLEASGIFWHCQLRDLRGTRPPRPSATVATAPRHISPASPRSLRSLAPGSRSSRQRPRPCRASRSSPRARPPWMLIFFEETIETMGFSTML